ncbi:receptor-like protein EIX2 [Aristolochia californica]|uniref:receptor-like protein EIX2 n=1 Tax=Aristolochia californica TaxID=171875 RepID=UPI0035D958E2
MTARNVISWTSTISSLVSSRRYVEAIGSFKSMLLAGKRPNYVTIVSVARAISLVDSEYLTREVHSFVIKTGLDLEASVVTAILGLYSVNAITDAVRLFYETPKNERSSFWIGFALLYSFGEVDSCRHLFDILHPKDVVAWSAMVSVYAQAGKPKIALNTLKQMQSANEKPNEITFVSLLQACSLMGAEEHGKSIHSHVYRKEYSQHLVLNSALIDFYSKLGRLSQAKAVFDHMDSKDLICWSSMINGYGAFEQYFNQRANEVASKIAEAADSLAYLDLSGNQFSGSIPSTMANLTSLDLTHLDLHGNEFSGSIPSTMANLTSLEFLDLSYNSIGGRIPRSFNNLCNLRILQLSGNSISSWERLTGCLANSLEALYVSRNQLKESLQVWLGETSNFKTLKFLDLSDNLFSGFIPSSIGSLSSLEELYLADNKLGGYIPQSIGKLSNLRSFDIANNSFTFVITESLFTKVESLEYINLAHNNLVWNVISQWLPPNILYIDISSCPVGPKFPSWLQHHKSVSSLQMSNSSISDVIPDWFWNITVKMYYLDLSHNQLQGKLPNSFLQILDLSNDSFSGPVLEKNMSNLIWLDISNNFLNGSIPSLLCKLESLEYLDLSNNYLHGNIHDCWGNTSKSIWYINFSNNNFSGEIPSSLSDIPFLASLHLRNNCLSGELPSTMKKMKSLVVLDLAHNKLSGVIPTWLGENLSSLRILSLHSNMIYGNIPPQISNNSSLQYLDLSHNNLSGTIPRSLGDFSAMTKIHNVSDQIIFPEAFGDETIWDNIVMILKGVELENSKTLGFYNVIDLSVNSLSGDITEELTRLLGLVSLNLSSNYLKGNIPNKIGALKQLESLDLSRNRLFGEVPSSLSTLNFLSKLNLSYNNLSGRIPSGFQLQTLNDSSIYIGNDNLCGPPLSPCPTNEVPPKTEMEREKDDEFKMTGFFVSIGVGIVVGFWGFCAVLIFKRSWRIAYYRFCDDIIEKVIVAKIIWFARLKRKI